MTAVILAAGYGSRLRPLTDQTHKTMVSVAGERIIDRIMAALQLAGVPGAVVVLGYRSGEVREYLESRYASTVRLTFVENADYATTNNIHSLALALESVDDDFLLIECDLFFETELLRDLIEYPWPNVAMAARYRTGMDGTVLSADADGVVEGVFPTYAQGPNFDFSGKFKTLNIYKFSGEFLRDRLRSLVQYYTRSHSTNSYYEVVLGIIIYLRSAEIRLLDVSERRWAEIDDINDLAKAEYMFRPEGRYDSLSAAHGGYWSVDVLDYCYIRNMHFPTPSVLSDMRFNLEKLLFNYGSSQAMLNRELSHYLLAPEECCCVLNGASQGIKLLPEVLETDHIATFTPTFDEYLAVFPRVTTADAERASPLDLIAMASREGAGAVVLANPCNPTGCCYPQAEVIEFVEAAVRANLFAIVDESFIDFAGGQSASISGWMLENRIPKALVIKSLSKCLGAPGLRLGYVLSADSGLIAAMNARVPIWNLNSPAQYFLELLLKYRPEIDASFHKTIADRETFLELLAQVEFLHPYPSGGNFILCRLAEGGPTAEALARRMLAASSIYIKNCTAKFPQGSGEFVRFAVRLPAENLRLVAELKRNYAALQDDARHIGEGAHA
jgi:histidinol-phosphate/aromatic aminotransferase/cobyric acid decarboxylase-like protein/GTP:adenosylcobinamide-phosphate guanylyltransferase